MVLGGLVDTRSGGIPIASPECPTRLGRVRLTMGRRSGRRSRRSQLLSIVAVVALLIVAVVAASAGATGPGPGRAAVAAIRPRVAAANQAVRPPGGQWITNEKVTRSSGMADASVGS